jgi:hypothetical protein
MSYAQTKAGAVGILSLQAEENVKYARFTDTPGQP